LLIENRLPIGLFLSFLLCFSLITSVRAEDEGWSEAYGGEGWDAAQSVVEASDGGYVVGGYTESFGAGGYDFWLIKVNVSGVMEWNVTYGGAGNDVAYSLVATSDGGYALAGATNSFGAGGYDFWLVKVDSSGTMLWNRTYGGAGDDFARSVIEVSGGGYALAGACNCSVVNGFGYFFAHYYGGDLWLVKTDASGVMEWDVSYGGAGDDGANALVEVSGGGYALAGYTESFGAGDGDSWLVKTDSLGGLEWNQTYNSGYLDDLWEEGTWEEACSLVATSDGKYALAGRLSLTYDSGVSSCWLVKTDSLGNVEWNETYTDTILYAASCSLVATSDGGYVLAGSWNFADYYILDVGGGPVQSGNFWLFKIDAFGNIVWTQNYGRGLIDWAYSVTNSSDGGYIVAGVTRYSDGGSGDFWLVKTDEYGVVPEAAWVVLPLLVIATLAILISKKKLRGKKSEEARFLCGI
jgi:hypothetical protein